jgi:NTP pyrophosphatase (non-canonical NTP hydrolase)
MDFNEYQIKARSTAMYPGADGLLSKKVAEEIYEAFIEGISEQHFFAPKEVVVEEIRGMIKLLDLIPLLYTALGLAGETGEILEKIKKQLRDKGGEITQEFKDTISKELGDAEWYHKNMATELGLNSSDIAEANIEKLASRKARGVLQGSGDNR